MSGLEWGVRGGMFVLMFGMGLSLRRRDFARIALLPKAALLGSGVQLVAMPLVGIALALAFDLPPLLAAGLVVTAACPGGTFSNLVVHLGRADTALSITLTATATLVALLTIPLWVNAILQLVGGPDAAVRVPVLGTALQLGAFTLLPVGLGMALRAYLREVVRWEALLTRLGVATVSVAFVLQVLTEEDGSLSGASRALPPVLALLGSGVLLGYGLPVLGRLPAAQSATIGVEVCLKNTVLGVALAELSLGLGATLPIALYTLFHLPVALGILVTYRVRARESDLPPARPAEGPSTG